MSYYLRLVLWTSAPAVISAAMLVPSCMYAYHDEHTAEITVRKAERVQSGKHSQYLVFTEDEEVYCIDDSLWRWTFDASDRYARIEPGQTYECRVVGWRWRFFSSYPNLLTVRRVQPATRRIE